MVDSVRTLGLVDDCPRPTTHEHVSTCVLRLHTSILHEHDHVCAGRRVVLKSKCMSSNIQSAQGERALRRAREHPLRPSTHSHTRAKATRVRSTARRHATHTSCTPLSRWEQAAGLSPTLNLKPRVGPGRPRRGRARVSPRAEPISIGAQGAARADAATPPRRIVHRHQSTSSPHAT